MPGDTSQLKHAAEILQQGGVIAYPTEAVYGLGCDPADESALQRILDIKGREAKKGFILIAASYQQLKPFIAELEKQTEQALLASWPGPVTWLVPAKQTVSTMLRGEHSSIAVRVTDHALVISLCESFGGAIVSTSANPAGKEPARSASQVKEYFGDRLDAILEGDTGGLDRPTEIRDAITGQVIRPV